MNRLLEAKKRAAKIKNYWFSDSAFRQTIYSCIDNYCSAGFLVRNTENLRRLYPDLAISDNEISSFLSGLFFNHFSWYSKYDPHHSRYLTQAQIHSKNEILNSVGRELGCYGTITVLYSLTSEVPSPFEQLELSNQMVKSIQNKHSNFPDLKLEQIRSFHDGMIKYPKFLSIPPNQTSTQNTLALLAGSDATQEFIEKLKQLKIFIYFQRHLESPDFYE